METQTADQRACAQSLCGAAQPTGKGLCCCHAVWSALWQREPGCEGVQGSVHPWPTENQQSMGSVGCNSSGEAVCSSAGPDVSTGLLQNRATGLYSQGGYLPRVWALLAQEVLVPLSDGIEVMGSLLFLQRLPMRVKVEPILQCFPHSSHLLP